MWGEAGQEWPLEAALGASRPRAINSFDEYNDWERLLLDTLD